jgi:hypothetical protein
LENKWESFDEEHDQLYEIWWTNIKLGLTNKAKGIWSGIDYQEHMIKIAKEVRLPSRDIKAMESDLQYMKINGFSEYIKKRDN